MTHLVLTFTHFDCARSPTGRTDFEIQVGDEQNCPKCGRFVEVKPMYFEGNSTERSPLPDISQRPPSSGIRK